LRGLRALWRLLGVVVHVLFGLSVCALVFPALKPPRRMHIVSWWSRGLLARLGITLEHSGVPQPGPVLLVANHVSWLDIVAIDAVCPARFVSKSEIRHWPVLGWMVACGGTLFIERERARDALRVVHHMAEALRAGEIVAVFPEGTTSDGRGVLPFHANLLQAAIATQAPVQAIALRFADAHGDFSAAVEYLGDTTIVDSLRRVLRADGLRVVVRLLPPLATDQAQRRELAERLQVQIAAAIVP
jgi:1-acyl-sn-glycerol-3-phosphate acyltransferase